MQALSASSPSLGAAQHTGCETTRKAKLWLWSKLNHGISEIANTTSASSKLENHDEACGKAQHMLERIGTSRQFGHGCLRHGSSRGRGRVKHVGKLSWPDAMTSVKDSGQGWQTDSGFKRSNPVRMEFMDFVAFEESHASLWLRNYLKCQTGDVAKAKLDFTKFVNTLLYRRNPE